MRELSCDILIVGSGGAGLFAAIRAYDNNPKLNVVMATKGLVGKSGCTRMVQGGYNAVLNANDSLEMHFQDTIKGGGFLNDQELAWVLVNEAPQRIYELESRFGCFFDRDAQGRIHQKPFAAQSFDRTIHRGDLTGIEIVSRLRDQLFRRGVTVLEETRAVELLTDQGGSVVGALLLDSRTGEFIVANARATLTATGGGAALCKISAPSLEKTGDGVAMAYRAGAELMDMEMLQFHPTGLLAGKSRLTGSVLEEGLRGSGGYMRNAQGERYMERYDPVRKERATRDVVSRASYMEIMAGRGTANGGVWIDVSHLGFENVCRAFPGMRERVLIIGKDLAKEPIEVSPTAHFHMGGLRIDVDCASTLPGLFAAGEDAAGVHGSNRLGGNGVAESIVFGARAGNSLAEWVEEHPLRSPRQSQVEEIVRRATRWFGQGGERPAALRDEIRQIIWEKVGLVRTGKEMDECLGLLQGLRERLDRAAVGGPRQYNLAWQDAMNVANMLDVSELLAQSALTRTESRGSHYRADFPQTDPAWIVNVLVRRGDSGMEIRTRPVSLTRVTPETISAKAGVAPGIDAPVAG